MELFTVVYRDDDGERIALKVSGNRDYAVGLAMHMQDRFNYENGDLPKVCKIEPSGIMVESRGRVIWQEGEYI
jgi:hypothetical protein